MGPTRSQTQARNRARLLAAAAEEFAREGLEGANINRISLAAGLGKGTVYNYFASKEALFLAVVEEACTLAAREAESVPASAATGERLRAALAADMEWVRRHEAFARVFVRETLTARPEFYAHVLKAAAPFVDRIASILRDGVARGEVRDDVPAERLAMVFIGLGDLALVQHWGSSGGWPELHEIPDLVVRIFLEGAAPRTTPKEG